MSESPFRPVPPFPGAERAVDDTELAGVVVEARAPRMAVILVRAGQQDALAGSLRSRLGVTLPAGPTCSVADGLTIVGTGPRRWLAVMEEETPLSPAGLAADLADLASVSDQSSGFAVLRVGGPKVRAALAKGVPIDLHDSSFAPGDAAVTSVGHIGVTMWRSDTAPSYNIAVFRSFAGSFWQWLSESAAEFGLSCSGWTR